MASYPTIKIGALMRLVRESAEQVDYDDIDQDSALTPNVGALVRDVGEERALMAMELRRRVVDPLLDLNNLAGFVRPGYEG
jgi:hypothetical protein